MANQQDVKLNFSMIDGVSKGIGSIEKKAGGLSAALTKIGPAAAVAAAATAALVTAGLGSALSEGVQDAAKFELALDRIGAKAGVSGQGLTQLGSKIRDIGQASGKSADESALAFQKLIDEGLSASEALAALPTALDFATSSAQKADAAVGGLADAMDAFGLGAGSFERGADVISAGALKAGTGVADMQAQLATLGPTASDVKLSLEGTAAALGVLAQNGIEGGRGAKSLLAILDQLRDPASKFRTELAKIGITSSDFNVVLKELAAAGPKAAAAFNALGTNATASLKALSKDGGAAVADLTAQLGKVQGATSATAKAIRDNLLSAWDDAINAFDNARAEFLTPILEPLKDELIDLTAKIKEFAASPEFASLRDTFAEAFENGITAIHNFVAAFDFGPALAGLESFVKTSGDLLKVAGDNAQRFADSTGAAFNALRVALNTLQAATALSVQVLANQFELLLTPLSLVSEEAERARDEFEQLGKIAGAETKTQFDDLKDSAGRLGKNIFGLADANDKAADSQLKLTRIIGSGADKQAIFAQKQQEFTVKVLEFARAMGLLKPPAEEAGAGVNALNDALAMGPPLMTAAAIEAQNLARGLDKLGNVIPITAFNQGLEDSKKSFKAVQAEIQASIDASKNLASSLSDVKDSASEAADSVAEFGAAVAEDAGYSDAVFGALKQGFDEVSADLALLRGVSQQSIKDGFQRDLAGATSEFSGLNDAINRGRAQIELLGGQTALERLRKGLADAAAAAENLKERTQAARSELAGLVNELQNAEDERNGNQAAIEQRRYQEQLDRINKLAAEAGFTDMATAERARKLAAAEHQAKLREIGEQAAARINAETGADAAIKSSRSGSVGTLPSAGAGGTGMQTDMQPGATVNYTFNIQALTGRQAIEEAARALRPELTRQHRNTH